MWIQHHEEKGRSEGYALCERVRDPKSFYVRNNIGPHGLNWVIKNRYLESQRHRQERVLGLSVDVNNLRKKKKLQR